MMEAFVYCWSDHKTGMMYVGSHMGSPEDGYVCSSKYMLVEYNKRTADFTREIIAFGSEVDIRVLEAKILQSLNVSGDSSFYNRHNGDGKFYNPLSEKFLSDLIERNKTNNPSSTTKGRKRISEMTKTRVGFLNSHYGKRHNEETIKFFSECKTGHLNPNFNKQFSESTKLKMSIARKKYWESRKAGVTL